MKKYFISTLGATFFFLILLPTLSAPQLETYFGAEAIDLLNENGVRALRFEHKKMNSRLDQVINEKLKALQNSQEVVLWQVEKISKLEAAGEKLRAGLIAQFGELKGALAEDIDTLAQLNHDRLLKMKKALEDQNKVLTATQVFFQTFFRDELIPALEKQTDANRKDIQAEIKALRAEMHGSLVSFKDFFRDELIPFFEKQYEADRQALREEVTQAKTEPEGQSDVNRETSSGNLGTDVQNETNSEFMERMLK